jgi:hypothetical protein
LYVGVITEIFIEACLRLNGLECGMPT